MESLIAIGSSVVPKVIKVFEEKNEPLTRMAINVCSELRDVRAIADLSAILNNTDYEGYVQSEAVWALSQIGTPEALQAVEHWKRSSSRQ